MSDPSRSTLINPEISVEAYDAEERRFRTGLSFSEIMAFETTTFTNVGFPARVFDERELARYVDWNTSSLGYLYFQPDSLVVGPSVRTAFTDAERELIGTLTSRVADMTGLRYGRRMRPILSLLAQLGMFRLIMALIARSGHEISVFEVGPGNGYLGALLA
ncbi:MAG: hypothetical protein WCH43_15635, partial [Verrucomicrobiota bacterium]